MGNITAGQNVNNVLDELFAENLNIANNIVKLVGKKPKLKLSSKVRYVTHLNDGDVILNDELADSKVYKIASELALAIDKNNSSDVKRIKFLYADTDEFSAAKDFLNKLCKEVWDVIENKNKKMDVPKEAMKALGITNKPSLDFLLGDCLKNFERENDDTTAKIISSILENPNLDYTPNDIFEYLKTNYEKKRYKYNFATIKVLAENNGYNLYKLGIITSDGKQMKKYYKSLPLSKKIKIFFSTLCQVAEELKIV